ncbi:MAG: SHOCT domain-containing protein [Solirubrobacteraceae bacterium]|jgi:uncharacterized membrane protein
MHGGMMFMGVGMVVWALILIALVVALIYAAVRLGRSRGWLADSARRTLDRRLATGEISPDEYYERESALRSGQPPTR